MRAASAPSSVYDSNISCCGWPIIGSWKKWSITKTVSKPDCSAATAWAATRSNSWAGATPGYVKLGIWRPRWVRFMIESLDHRKSSMIDRAPSVQSSVPPQDPVLTSAGYLMIKAGHYLGQGFEAALAALGHLGPRVPRADFVRAADGLSQQELSARLGLDPTIVVGLVDGLEDRGPDVAPTRSRPTAAATCCR